jgi:hypothetical protein
METQLTLQLLEALEASDECLALIEDVGHGAHMDNVTVTRKIVTDALAVLNKYNIEKNERTNYTLASYNSGRGMEKLREVGN